MVKDIINIKKYILLENFKNERFFLENLKSIFTRIYPNFR